MLTESRFNKFLLSCTKIGVVLCLMMCCSIGVHAKYNTHYDIDFSNASETSDGRLTDNSTALSPPENTGSSTCDLVVICPPAGATISCNDENPADLFGLIGGAIDSTATVPCGDVTITNDFVLIGVCGDNVSTTFTITDGVTTTTCVSQISIATSEPPVIINCPPDMEISCAADAVADTTQLQFTTDCAEVFVLTADVEAADTNSECGETPGDQYFIAYNVGDECGTSTSQCIQTFTISEEAIQLICPADVTGLVCGDTLPAPETTLLSDCTAPSEFTVTNVSDSDLPTSFCIANDLVVTRTYTAVNACGSEAQCTQTFTFVSDSEPPQIQCLADVVLTCGDDLPAPETTLPGTDNCDSATEFAVVGIVENDPPAIFCEGNIFEVTRVYTVEDACGNRTFCPQLFTFETDSTPPTITCPPDPTTVFTCNDPIPAPDVSLVVVTDNCTPAFGIVVTHVGDELGNDNAPCVLSGERYSILRTYRATDACGNSSICMQRFTIAADKEPPVVTCPANVTGLVCGDTIPVAETTLPGTDNCDPATEFAVTNVVDSTSPTSFCEISDVITIVRTYTIEDACGNEAICTQFFEFEPDSEGPTLNCPADVTLTCNDDLPVAETTLSGTDNCDTATEFAVTNVVDSALPTNFCSGDNLTVTRIYTVEDNCGNEAQCIQTFTFLPVEAPTISCPADTTVSCFEDISVDISDVSFTTSCSMGATVSIGSVIPNGTFNCPGTTYTYAYTVEDACGRTATCNRVFTIANDAPTISCPEDCPVACASDIRPGTPEFITSCGVSGILSLTGPVIDGDPHCDGTTYTYTHTVTDACGRTATCDQVFTIVNECHLVDFDYDDEGHPLHPGTDIFDQYKDFTITTDNPHRCVQLFDTGHPTANDYDLGTPNQQYGGPGIGAGGANNTTFQGNALIVSKDCGVPNETEGQLIFTFDCSVTIKTVDLLDMKCGHSEIELYDEHHNLIEELPIPGYGVNSFNTFQVNVSGVYTMIVDLDCGGAVTTFKYCKDNAPGTDCVAPDLCEDYNLDFDNSAYHWTTNSTSGSFDVGNQNYTISIADEDGILEDTYENAGGLLVGIDPHNIHDEVVICYNLSQVSDNVSFDIFDLDYKNYQNGSRQQEAVCVYGLLGNDPTQILPTITSLDGHVDIDGNCAEATTNSAISHRDESVLVEFSECIDKVIIVYGTGSNSPVSNPSYSKITIGESIGFNSEVCAGACIVAECGTIGDSDGDGVCNNEDVCPGGDDSADRDGDGIPDACDDICYDYNIDHGDCGAAWGHNDTSGSVELGNDNIDISIIDNDNIFVDSQANGVGLQVGINPHNVNDELVVCYNLSKSSNNVVFDITDLDLKNGNSKQQEKVCVFGTLGANQTPILPTVTSLDGHVNVTDNCGEATTNSASSRDDESILVEFTECIDKITIVYGTGSNSPTHNPSYSKITIGESIFTVEQCKDACEIIPCSTQGAGADNDGDGVCDDQDICPGADDNVDTDGDGIPDGCDDTAREDQTNVSISLYPNPAYGSDNVTIEIDTEARGDVQLLIVDALGRVVEVQNIELVNNITLYEMSTDRLSSAVYFVQLRANDWRTDAMKLVVVKP